MPRTPQAVKYPPQSVSLEPYWKQSAQWPSSGQTILASYDSNSIVVYMEVSKFIAEYAVRRQCGFRVGHEPLRVYTSFIPMQAFTEWSTKADPPHKLQYQQNIIDIREGRRKPSSAIYANYKSSPNSAKEQRRTLAVRVERRIFDSWIDQATLINESECTWSNMNDQGDEFHNTESFNGWTFNEGYWRYNAYEKPDVAYRWVNDIHPCLPLNGTKPQQRLARQTIQLRIHGDAAIDLDKSCLGVEDITPFVDEMRVRLSHHQIVSDLWSPAESQYPKSPYRTVL